ncbi:MAG: hypothetical protein H7240_02955 [Glaciimonas sp.]|nr:hypothetical protein [Glaciimonas sp.]
MASFWVTIAPTLLSNLENQWLFSSGNPGLNLNVPTENQILNVGEMATAMLNTEAPIVLALNLDSYNSDPDTAAFFFPHFDNDAAKYYLSQQKLWQKQLSFIKAVAVHYDGKIECPPVVGGARFLATSFPETWWWAQTADAVNAITPETTYGKTGFDQWITEDDLTQFRGRCSQDYR